jgi:hypothetical protein
MKLVRGPRPLAIRVFAAAFFAAAVLRLARGLDDVEMAAIGLAKRAPWFAWDSDWTIIALSAEFTIALIPLAWIYLFAAPFARWLVIGFGALKLWGLRLLSVSMLQSVSIASVSLAEPALVLIAMVSLLTVGANHWFMQRKENGSAVFE